MTHSCDACDGLPYCECDGSDRCPECGDTADRCECGPEHHCEDCGAHLAAADGTDSGAIQQVVAAWNTRSELQPEEAP